MTSHNVRETIAINTSLWSTDIDVIIPLLICMCNNTKKYIKIASKFVKIEIINVK